MTKTAVNNAQAVLEMGVEKEEMEKAQNIYFLSPCLHKVLQSPVQPAAKKYAVIDSIFKDESITLRKFLKVLCRNGNIKYIKDIFKAYYELWDKKEGIIRAEAVFAKKPSENKKEEIQKELEKKYPNNKIILTESIDEALLGGYIIKVKDIITDRSGLGMLIQLEKNLTGGVGCGC